MEFSIKVTFTKKILDGKLHFLCSVCGLQSSLNNSLQGLTNAKQIECFQQNFLS